MTEMTDKAPQPIDPNADEQWRVLGTGVGLALGFTGLGISLSIALRRRWIAAIAASIGVASGILYVSQEGRG